jgi:YesN/AraC family two-component response regulator
MKIDRVKQEMLKTVVVLSVEDDEEIQRQLSLFLKEKVGALYSAFDGQKGLELYLKHKPNIIITDIRMPFMDGLEMAKIIREIDPNIPIIITTAFNKKEYVTKANDIGINEYIEKPINPYLLLNTIIKCLKLQLTRKIFDGRVEDRRHL